MIKKSLSLLGYGSAISLLLFLSFSVAASGTSTDALTEVLEDSSSRGGANNANGTAVTALQLMAITGIADIDPANEAAYQAMIATTGSFSTLPLVSEVQVIVDLVNASELAIAELLEDSSSIGGSSNANTVPVTAAQITAITGIINVDPNNETAYQALVVATSTFSNPPTVAEIQATVDGVNANHLILIEVLEDSNSTGGANNADNFATSASKLASIVGLQNVNLMNEAAYQADIAAATTFSNPPTVAEVQSIVDQVNAHVDALEEVLEDSPSVGGASNANANAVTAAQLAGVIGIGSVDPANEGAYQSLIATTTSFSDPPLVAEVQTIVDLVNTSVLALKEVLEDSVSVGGQGNANNVAVSKTQLSSITGITDVSPNREVFYQSEIFVTSTFSNPPSVVEVQAVVDAVNASESAMAEVLEDSNAVGGQSNQNNVAVTANELAAIIGIVNVSLANEAVYQSTIASADSLSNPPTLIEVQTIVDTVNTSEQAFQEILEDSASAGGSSDTNASPVTAVQLAAIIGIQNVQVANEIAYQLAINSTTTFGNPVMLAEIQGVIDGVNGSQLSLLEVLEDSSSMGGSQNSNSVAVTDAQLNAILGIESVVYSNEVAYQALIASTSTFSNLPTVAEIQAVIDAVNTSEVIREEVLEDSNSVGGAQNSNEITVTASNLAAITGIVDVLTENETAYQLMIALNSTFSSPPAVTEIQALIDAANLSESVILEVLEDSVSTGGAANSNELAVTAEDLAAITGIVDVVLPNEAAYRAMIAASTNFSNPPTVLEIQQIVNTANTSESAIAEVLEDSNSVGGDSNANGDVVTVLELAAITDVVNVVPANEIQYQEKIAATTTFSNSPLISEIQAVLDAVNASQLALAEILEDSASAFGADNDNGISVTAAELAAVTGVTGINSSYENDYQIMIGLTETFSNPVMLVEIQAIINAVNASETARVEILEDSTSSGGAENSNAQSVTAAQLAAITGIENVDPASESKYKSLIAITDTFSNPPTVVEIQTIIDTVNASEQALAEVLEDSVSTGGMDNSNELSVTAAQLSAISGITNIDSVNEAAYQAQIALTSTFSNKPTALQVQAIVNTVNTSELAITELQEDSLSIGGAGNANAVAVSATQLGSIIGITNVNAAYEPEYQALIAASTVFSNRPELAEIQAVVDSVNISGSVLQEILEDSISSGGSGNANSLTVSAVDLTMINGIVAVDFNNELAYQSLIAATSTLSNPPTVAETQGIIDRVNDSQAALSEVLEDSVSPNGDDNSNEIRVTVVQLSLIVGINGLSSTHESLYQSQVAATTSFSDPPTVAQVQAIVDAVNVSESVRLEVLEDSASNGGAANDNESPVSVSQLAAVIGLTDVLVDNELFYQAAVAANPSFSNPPTVAEIQSLVDEVNVNVEALTEVLEDSVSDGGAGNENEIPVTAGQLAAITGIINVLSANEDVYQQVIAETSTLSNLPTVVQVQTIVDSANARVSVFAEILEDSASPGGAGNSNGIPINVTQIAAIPGVSNVNPANEVTYQTLIASTASFSNPPTLSEIQSLIDMANVSADVMEEVLEDSISDGGSFNRNRTAVTAAELNLIVGIARVNPAYELEYQIEIILTTTFSNPPSVEEVQLIVDGVNATTDSDEDGVPDAVELQQGTLVDDAKNYLDSDDDGVPDMIELLEGSDPFNATSYRDSDGGGAPDYVETYILVPASNPLDATDDTRDSDGDGVADFIEALLGTDQSNSGTAALDSDGDGVTDFQELLQGSDPFDSTSFVDSDEDGIPDAVEGSDDLDADGIANYLDLDSDNDGLTDEYESGQNSTGLIGFFDDFADGPVLRDFDDDGIADFIDRDGDNDGIPDVIEVLGVEADPTWSGNIANFIDIDGNGLDDAVQAVTVEAVDSDADGIPNYLDLDSDGDGISDLVEAGGVDADNDGMLDAIADSDNDGIPDSADYDVIQLSDVDNDGIDDSVDASFIDNAVDTDGDGIEDRFDFDPEGDGYTPLFLNDLTNIPELADTDGDGEPDIYQVEPALGAAPSSVSQGSGGCSIGSADDSSLPLLLLFAMLHFYMRRRQYQ